MSGFPAKVVFEGNGRGERERVTTRLFPDMKFGCFGTIVGVTAAVLDNGGSQQPPIIQIWRENGTQPGLYHKTRPSDVKIRNSNPPCYQNSIILNNRIFQCTLTEDYHISVQPGDFLGLEIPPIDNDDFEVYFKAGGPTNLVFQGQRLGSTVDLSTEPHVTTNDEPQITFLVVLGTAQINVMLTMYKQHEYYYVADESRNLCPSADTSTTVSTAISTTQTDTASNSVVPTVTKESGSSASGTIIVGIILGVAIAILLLVAIVLLVIVLIQLRHKKQHTLATESSGCTYPNPVYDG